MTDTRLPDLAFFCANGHLVCATNATEELDVDKLQPCPVCHCQHLRAVANWPQENSQIVPAEPEHQAEADVYDVSQLFANEEMSAWTIHLDQFTGHQGE